MPRICAPLVKKVSHPSAHIPLSLRRSSCSNLVPIDSVVLLYRITCRGFLFSSSQERTKRELRTLEEEVSRFFPRRRLELSSVTVLLLFKVSKSWRSIRLLLLCPSRDPRLVESSLWFNAVGTRVPISTSPWI